VGTTINVASASLPDERAPATESDPLLCDRNAANYSAASFA
jgi:hypothetical protein